MMHSSENKQAQATVAALAADDDWVDTNVDICAPLPPGGILNAELLSHLFPTKSAAKRDEWLRTLKSAEFDTVGELSALPSEGWAELTALPLGVRTALRAHTAKAATDAAAATATGEASVCNSSCATAIAAAPPSRVVTQVDVVVMDVSCSMRARSALDAEGWVDPSDPSNRLDIDASARSRSTREDVSKLLFHTLVDKTLVFELEHAVGLVAFGETVTPINVGGAGHGGGASGSSCITREYERFHDELGRLDANQGCTKLYDAVRQAAEMVNAHAASLPPPAEGEEPPRKRVFVLTDGEDNASSTRPWQLAQLLQRSDVLLDAIPLAGVNATLRGLCVASGGLCLDVLNQQQGVGLFEKEATLHVACRPSVPAEEALPHIDSDAAFTALVTATSGSAPMTAVATAACKSAKAQVMSPADVAAAAKRTPSGARSGGAAADMPGAAVRRALKEYGELCTAPAEGWRVFVCADDNLSWKAVLSGLPEPYAGGSWLVTVDFPRSYPFAPPRVRFETPMYHCNVGDGRICLGILNDLWSPALSVKKVLLNISELMRVPDASNPLDAFKGALYRDNRAKYLAEASSHTQAHAAASYEQLAMQYKLPLSGADE